jgi:hypothetical protein
MVWVRSKADGGPETPPGIEHGWNTNPRPFFPEEKFTKRKTSQTKKTKVYNLRGDSMKDRQGRKLHPKEEL